MGRGQFVRLRGEAGKGVVVQFTGQGDHGQGPSGVHYRQLRIGAHEPILSCPGGDQASIMLECSGLRQTGSHPASL
jgi:hypothetical protein